MLAESTRLVAKEDFDAIRSTQRDQERKRAAARNMQASGGVLGALPDNLIDDLIVPSSEHVGIRLLKRMGWKPGQGIGPRVTRRQRKPKDGPLLDDDDEDLPANITFAPIDSEVVKFTHKTDHFGLGYDPFKDAPEFDKSLQARTESKYLSRESGGKKTGFGFGTFDDDDEDGVYGSGPASLRSLDSDAILDDKPKFRRKESKEKPGSQSDTLAPSLCSDGRPPLPGFVLAKAPPKPIKWYPAPRIPRDFVPHHTFSDDVKPVLPSNKRQQPKLTADDRALVLGETPIDAPRRSVFEYMSSENKSRLDNLLGFVMDTEGDKRLRKDHWEVPEIEKSAAEAALKGFMPFGDNIAKQNRYKQYLNVQAGISDEKIELVEGFAAQDMTKELNEFVQAARIFKPLTSSMANRFTSATKTIEFAQPAAGLRTAEDIKASVKTAPMQNAVEKMEIPKSQAAKAAAMGMFGPLTRTTVEFYPSKLLCKRFNVPNPHPDHKDLGPEGAKDLLDKDTMDRMMMNRKSGEGMPSEDKALMSGTEGSPAAVEDTRADVVAEEETPEEPELIQERPPMDIFKAIFDDSDSESEDEPEDEIKKNDDGPGQEESGMDVIRGMDTVGIKVDALVEEEEKKPQEPFRPMFTKKTNRPGASSSSATSQPQSRSSKLDLSHLDEDEDEDENEIGPKLAMPKTTVSTSSKKSQSRTIELDTDNVDDTNGSAATSASVKPVPARERSSSPDEFIGPIPPSLRQDQGKRRKNDSGSDQDSHTQEKTQISASRRRDDSYSSKRHKPSSSTRKESPSSSSRHKSSSSRSDRNDRHSRHRSSSRSKRSSKRDDSDDDIPESDHSEASKGETKERERRKEHSSSTSSKSKSKRHRERSSRSRSTSPKSSSNRSHRKDRDRDRDRDDEHDRERERRSKRSRDEKSSSKHRSDRRRNRDKGDDEGDMEGLWVEKEVDIPSPAGGVVASTKEPPQRTTAPANRPRATSFF
ncbi:hypothetical protein BGZ58_000967 [Dissophora ornata]|nr:hypothetical protein BGZ58_000967 [Dissophora ornata]